MTYEELESLVAKGANLIASLAAEGRETDRLLKENASQMKETDRKMQETASQMRETDRKIAQISKQIGGIDNNIGYHAEQFFQNVFADKKVFGGIKYDEIVMNMKFSEDVEFDIVLKNGKSVALIEVKNRIRPNFVKKLAEERVNKFRKCFSMYKNHDVYLGIAGFSFDTDVLEEARKYGVGIVRQVGDGIEVDATGLKAYR
ncbi:MAG: hypothetical protein LBQ87_07470 [Candidatus Fibromonas sp.]|nr:hypothetical protein [Candidatus Fibromonas sp.]